MTVEGRKLSIDDRQLSAISLKAPLADADKVLRWPGRIADMEDCRRESRSCRSGWWLGYQYLIRDGATSL